MKFGAHMSTSGGVSKALERGASAGWAVSDLDEVRGIVLPPGSWNQTLRQKLRAHAHHYARFHLGWMCPGTNKKPAASLEAAG